MKRIQVAYGGRSRIFGVPSGAPDEALLALVRLEFALPADASLALELHFADGTFTLLPFVGAAVENNVAYALRVYGASSAPTPAPVAAAAALERAGAALEARVAASLEHRLPRALPADPAALPAPVEQAAQQQQPQAQQQPQQQQQQQQQAKQAPVVKAKAAKKEKSVKSVKTSVSAVKPLAAGQKCDPENEAQNWSQHKAEDSGHPYWYNNVTGESTWDKPVALKNAAEDATEANQQSQKYYEDEGYDPFEDDQYFDSYTDVSLQGEMVGDRSRSDSYLRAMLRFKESDFKDKVVLDCGCGTGLLSFFAIKAGAKKVYAIEGSNLAFTTREVVERNGLGDKILVYHARMEDVELPEKVDTIVSEWMGAALIFESMLGSVLYARDKWLKPGGMLYPSRSTMFYAPIEAQEFFEKKIDFWSDVYGMDMTSFLGTARQCCVEKPMFDRLVAPNDVLCKYADVLTLIDYDLMTMSIDEIEQIKRDFRFVAKRDGTLHGFAVWFTSTFESGAIRRRLKEKLNGTESEDGSDSDAAHHNGPTATPSKSQDDEQDDGGAALKAMSAEERAIHLAKIEVARQAAEDAAHEALLRGEAGPADQVVVLSTAPDKKPTHWKQLSLLFDDGVPVRAGDELTGQIDILRNTYWRRHFNFDVDVQVNGEPKPSKSFGLWRYKTEIAPAPENIPRGAL